MEHEQFSTGEAFFPAFPGCLPASLRLLELSNFVESDVAAGAIAGMIEQSERHLDSILFSFCKFEDENFDRIQGALQGAKPNLKVLHYGYLHSGTVPNFAHSIATFGCLEELGVGFCDDLEAFELFCEELPHTTTVKTLDVQLNLFSDEDPTMSRFLRALAVAVRKLPNLGSITMVYLWSRTPVVENVPSEFLAALKAHDHLVDLPRRIRFGNPLVEYYLRRNRFRDRLASTKPVMLEAFRALDDGNPISCTLVKETLCSRDDWLRNGVDDGRPLPPPAKVAPIIRRYPKGPLF